MYKSNILVVDDERFFTSLIADILKESYRVSIANGGLEALDIIKKGNTDLIILDILMPDMDGYEVCRQIKSSEKGRDIPVIFLTIKTEIEDELYGFDLGAVDYITKPISPPIVKARVATHTSLAAANKQLKQHTLELELLVAERTIELSREIAKKQKAYAKLHYLANYDPLTQLPNRNLFNERLAYAYKLAKRNSTSFALLLVDLDRFKRVNDTLGHHIGDLLLEKVGGRLTTCLRDVDTIARLSGDEFTVILSLLNNKEDAATVAEKIITALACPFNVHGNIIHIGSSIGITSYPEDGEDFDMMFKHADMAMYEVKEKGRNAYAFYSSSLTTYVNHRMVLEKDLRIALDNNALHLNYQPITDLKSNNICGVEALLRWQHPTLGSVSPEEIISIAEESDLILALGEWILRTACTQFSAWKSQDLGEFHIAINMSTRQFCEKVDSYYLVEQLLHEFELSGAHLQLEITESLMLEDSDFIMDMLHKFKSLGIRLSMDDFGTGYSSLSYLRRFPIDILKIDKSFIQDLNLNSSDDALVKAIIAMGQSLGMKIIAEGVETAEQLQFLQAHSCDMVQGYYFSKPVDSREIERLIAKPLPELGITKFVGATLTT